MRGRTATNEHAPFPVVDDSTDGEAEGMLSAPTSKGTKRPAADEASDPPPPSKRRVSAASLFTTVPAPDPPQNPFRKVRYKKDVRRSFAFPMSPLRPRAEPRAMAAFASGSGSVDLSVQSKDKRQQSPPAAAGSALGSVEGTEIARLEAMAARHRAIAASIEKTIAELKRPFAPV